MASGAFGSGDDAVFENDFVPFWLGACTLGMGLWWGWGWGYASDLNLS